jgi:hypothetical protein
VCTVGIVYVTVSVCKLEKYGTRRNFLGHLPAFPFQTCVYFLPTIQCYKSIGHKVLVRENIFFLYFSSKLIFGLVILMRGVKEINTLLDQIKMVFSLCKMSFKQNDSISPAAAGKQSSKIIKIS